MLPSVIAPEADTARIVLVGDIVGKPGLRAACLAAVWLRRELRATGLLCNAENVADGSGMRTADYRRLIESGFDGITLGDHLYQRKEIIELLGSCHNIVRPCNLPTEAAGRTWMLLQLPGSVQLAVVSALGRVFMKPVDCPFHAVDRVLQLIPDNVKLRIVDFHAEATSDKQIMGRYLDGRVSAVLGTHTHVTTADEQILPGGTGFQCDVGMTGPFEGIIGRSASAVITSTLTGMPSPYHVATADVRVSATWCDLGIADGLCRQIGRVSLRHQELEDYVANRSASA